MDLLQEHKQLLVNELVDVLQAHVAEEEFEKINWANLLTLLAKLIEMLGPILFPVAAKTPTGKPKP